MYRKTHYYTKEGLSGMDLGDSTGTSAERSEVGKSTPSGPGDGRSASMPEKGYRAVFDNSSDAILVLGTDREIISCNKAFRDLMGYAETQIIGKSIRLIHPSEESFNAYGRKAYPIVDKENTFRTDWNFARRDGTVFPAETVTSAIRDEFGKIVNYVAIIRDMSERRAAERALRESEERYRIAIEHSNEGVAIVDASVHLYVNRKLGEMFGYDDSRQLVGKPIGLLVHDEDRERIASYVKERQNHGYAPSQYEFKGVKKDGTVIYIEASTATITYHGEQDSLTFMRDVTKRRLAESALRESEEKYRLLIENATEAIFIIQDGVIKFPNPRTERMSGYSAGELETIPFINHIHEDDKPLVLDHYRRKMRKEESASAYSLRMVAKNGSTLWGEINSVLIEWEGKPGTLNFIRDVTDQKTFESQFIQAQKMEAVGTLAGGIAHDFNNLLMVIQGYTSLMLYDVNPGHPHHKMLKQVEEQVKSGADLTKQLLGFARGGRYEIRLTNLNDIVIKSSAMFGRTKKEIVIHTRCEEALWAVNVDQGQMEQVLLNLYVNAWQAMPQGGNLSIETKNVELNEGSIKGFFFEPGKYVKITVTDTGTGMDEKTKERIFEPFFTTKEMGRGTGLGLASAYGIIKGHGGVINVVSEKGSGSSFEIYLPASGMAARDNRVIPGEAMQTRKGTETLLLVDDEEAILAVSSEILNTLGYKVLPAKSGKEAVDMYNLHKEEIDLVILDMIMPDISGGETFAFLKMINPRIKAILSSGYSLNDQAEGIMQQGCHAFIQKPFTIQNLSQKVREVLDGKK
jgi:two-component system, cell cycle sensor histidine kinase and response regulator CckA